MASSSVPVATGGARGRLISGTGGATSSSSSRGGRHRRRFPADTCACPRCSSRSGLGCPRPSASPLHDVDVTVRHKLLAAAAVVVAVDFARQFGIVERQIGLALRPPDGLAGLKVVRYLPILIENGVSPVNPPSVLGNRPSIALSLSHLRRINSEHSKFNLLNWHFWVATCSEMNEE